MGNDPRNNNIDDFIEKVEFTKERISRIERKVDSLADAIVSIARAEEKITSLIQSNNDIKESLQLNNKRTQELEVANATNSSEIEGLKKFQWLLVTATIGTFITAVVSAIIAFSIRTLTGA